METKEDNTVPYYIGKITDTVATALKKHRPSHKYTLILFEYIQVANGYNPTTVYFTDELTDDSREGIQTIAIQDNVIESISDPELVKLVSDNTMYLPMNESFLLVLEKTEKQTTYKAMSIRIGDMPTYDMMFHIDKYNYIPAEEPVVLTDKDKDKDKSVQYTTPVVKSGENLEGGRKRPRYSRKRIKQYRKKSRVRKVY